MSINNIWDIENNINSIKKAIIQAEIYQLEDIEDIEYMVNESEDFNYQMLEGIISDKKFGHLWMVAKTWIIEHLKDILPGYNDYMVDAVNQGYTDDFAGLAELMDDLFCDGLEYPRQFVMFDLEGNQTDITDEAYNNQGISVEIY